MVTATPASGTGHTAVWSRADGAGGTDFTLDSTTSLTPTFSIPSGTTAYSATRSWRCTLTDSTGKVTQGLVAITLQRTVAGGFSISVPSTAIDVAMLTGGPATAEVEVAATPSGATGTVSYVWTRIDPNGGSDFQTFGLTTASPIFQFTSSVAAEKTQTWRCTATDSGTGSTVVKDCAITLQVEA